MKTRSRHLAMAAVLACLPAALAFGQAANRLDPQSTPRPFDPAYDQLPAQPSPQARRGQSRVSLFHDPGGKLVLVVNYPWTLRAKPSVEVRLLGKGEPDGDNIQPMYFRWKHMKGDTTVAVYQCQDRSEDSPVRAVVQEKGERFEMVGDRNSLGSPSVCVARRVFPPKTGKRGEVLFKPGAAAAFPLLRPWSVDQRLLYLDLPNDYFAQRGEMKVWFLRDDRVVWTESLDWPGSASTRPKPPAAPVTFPVGQSGPAAPKR